MAATVNDVYLEFCYDVCEDAGLVLGILTVQNFLDLFNLTLADFLARTGLIKRIFTATVVAGVGQYTYPDDLTRIEEDAYLGGVLLPKADLQGLNGGDRDWRRKQGIPRAWYEDGLPIKTVALAPAPNFNGSYIPGAAEPDPPHAQYDSFSATVSTPAGLVVQNPRQHRGLTLIGWRRPSPVAALADPIPLLPDEFALGYLAFGIGERAYSGDNELADPQKALWCKNHYEEGIALARSITGELEDIES